MSAKDLWFDALVLLAQQQAAALPEKLHYTAGVALKYLSDNKQALIVLGESGCKEFLGLLALGKNGEARDHYIKTVMGPDAIIAQLRKNNKDIHAAMLRKVQLEQAFNSLLTQIGLFALNILVQIILKKPA